jgi:hypothetical protein
MKYTFKNMIKHDIKYTFKITWIANDCILL